jgi:hypothetical protein
MKQNNVPSCARRLATWPGNPARSAAERRQYAGQLSLITGTPAARTFGNLKPTNDLASTQHRPSKTKPRNPRAPEAIVRWVRALTQQNTPVRRTELRTSNPRLRRLKSPGLVSRQRLPADWAAPPNPTGAGDCRTAKTPRNSRLSADPTASARSLQSWTNCEQRTLLSMRSSRPPKERGGPRRGMRLVGRVLVDLPVFLFTPGPRTPGERVCCEHYDSIRR